MPLYLLLHSQTPLACTASRTPATQTLPSPFISTALPLHAATYMMSEVEGLTLALCHSTPSRACCAPITPPVHRRDSRLPPSHDCMCMYTHWISIAASISPACHQPKNLYEILCVVHNNCDNTFDAMPELWLAWHGLVLCSPFLLLILRAIFTVVHCLPSVTSAAPGRVHLGNSHSALWW